MHGRPGVSDVKRTLLLVGVLGAGLVLAGCAPGPNALSQSPDGDGEVAGFWHGLWHGVITPVTFVISLFSYRVHIYEVHNNGDWYNFGLPDRSVDRARRLRRGCGTRAPRPELNLPPRCGLPRLAGAHAGAEPCFRRTLL